MCKRGTDRGKEGGDDVCKRGTDRGKEGGDASHCSTHCMSVVYTIHIHDNSDLKLIWGGDQGMFPPQEDMFPPQNYMAK